MSKYETVIGLEVHVQLATATKVFCGCSTAFGAPPNSNVCPVCLGLPGVLPVLNKKAFEYAIMVAFALECDVQKTVKFDRKNYYYPDLPKNYQISQFDMPIAYDGRITIALADGSAKDIRVKRAHLEEDAGKLLHDQDASYSFVDLNRTGMPLLEIVSEPDLSSPEEAYSYLTDLKRIIKYLGVSDCNMEEGSLRCDANVSLRKKGDTSLGVKVEVKNLNSFKAVRDSLEYEVGRQAEMLDEGDAIVQETRLWDEKKNVTVSMRTKEEAHDYRYFPEPDLVPFEVGADQLERVRKEIPELPKIKEERFRKDYGLDGYNAGVLTAEREIAEFYEQVVGIYPEPRVVCNWITGEIMKNINERGGSIGDLGIQAEGLAELIRMSQEDRINMRSAREVLSEYIATGKRPSEIVEEKGLEQVSDAGELESMIDKVVSENAKSVNDLKNGKENALGFLIGQVMRYSKGKANPKVAGEMLKKKILS